VAISPGTAAAPGPVLDTATPTFTWQAVAGAGGDQVNIYDSSAKKFASFTVDASATSFTAPAGALKAGDSFIWNVRALNGSTSGPESNYLRFRIDASAHAALNSITPAVTKHKHRPVHVHH